MKKAKKNRWVVLYKDCTEHCPKHSLGFENRADAFLFSASKAGSTVVDTDRRTA